MTTSYPIVTQRELGNPVKRGPLGLVKRRESYEIPKIKPHEVLIWRVGDRYVKDQRELQAHDGVVVNASSVSVVSVRPDTEVAVSFRIDSRDSAEFTVKVIFICSVLDPVLVVKNGQVDAADTLLAYLRGYQDIFELGIEHPIAEINKVRLKLAAHIRAYLTHRPPVISGMRIASSATVQVETPAALGKIKEIDDASDLEFAKKRGEVRNAAFVRDHVLDSQEKMTQAVGHDPAAALHYSFAEGGITSQEYAERLQQLREAAEQRAQIERVADRTRQYELDDRKYERAHEQLLWDRKQTEERRREGRQDERDRVGATIELLKMLANHGHLDTYNADIEDLIRQVLGENEPGPEVTAGQQQAELTEGEAPRSPGPEDDNDE